MVFVSSSVNGRMIKVIILFLLKKLEKHCRSRSARQPRGSGSVRRTQVTSCRLNKVFVGFWINASIMAAVDVEDESILASIFKDSFPENWRGKPDFAAYLSQLSSCGVDELNREPERLAEERAQILQQTRELAFTNYKTFIRTADCTQHIYTDFSTVENCLSKLLHKLPSFTERCRSVRRWSTDDVFNISSIRHTSICCHATSAYF